MAVMMVVMVMVPVAPEVMVVMMVMVVVHLRELNPGLRRGHRRALINDFQRCCCVRDRLQQVGIGTGLQDFRRLGCRAGRGLGRA